jgi:hypothetical protein
VPRHDVARHDERNARWDGRRLELQLALQLTVTVALRRRDGALGVLARRLCASAKRRESHLESPAKGRGESARRLVPPHSLDALCLDLELQLELQLELELELELVQHRLDSEPEPPLLRRRKVGAFAVDPAAAVLAGPALKGQDVDPHGALPASADGVDHHRRHHLSVVLQSARICT